jgi:hypothetical protein
MKNIYKMLAVCLITLMGHLSQAQINKATRQHQFSRLSDKLPAATTELDKAFRAAEGTKIQLQFSNFSFSGIVTSSIRRYDHLQSVIIRSSALDNTIFSISKRINDDQTVTYTGRIINEKYADGFELARDSGGRYALNKIRTESLIEDY